MFDSTREPIDRPKRPAALTDDSSKPTDNGTEGNAPPDLNRLAQLIADGQIPIPARLHSATQQALVSRVADLRRSRFLRFIARAIAQDIHRLRHQE